MPKLCWDASHGHTLGGGDFWTTGYAALMEAINKDLYDTTTTITTSAAPAPVKVAEVTPTPTPKVQKASASYPMVTEDNAEPYMGMIQGFLTLNAFKGSLAQSSNLASTDTLPIAPRVSPAFPMVNK